MVSSSKIFFSKLPKKNQSLHNTLYKLSKDPNIRVCNYGKGNGIAVMNTKDYYGKLDEIVNDK